MDEMSYKLEYQNHLNRNVICVLVFLFLLNIGQSWRPFELEFYDPSYMVYHPEALGFNFTIAKDEHNSFSVNFKQQFSNVYLHLKYVFADRNGIYNLIYVNKTINLCEFLANRKMDVLLRVLFTVGERFGDLPKRCPLFKKVYYVANMKISADNLPPVMPQGKGILTFTVMSKVREQFKTYITANVSFKLENVFKQGN